MNASMVLDVGYLFGLILGSLLNLEKEKKRSISLYHISSFKRGNSKMYKYADTKTTQEKFILVYHEMKY